MVGVTDLHFRYLARLVSRRCMLYSEMTVTVALYFNQLAHYAYSHRLNDFVRHQSKPAQLHTVSSSLGDSKSADIGRRHRGCIPSPPPPARSADGVDWEMMEMHLPSAMHAEARAVQCGFSDHSCANRKKAQKGEVAAQPVLAPAAPSSKSQAALDLKHAECWARMEAVRKRRLQLLKQRQKKDNPAPATPNGSAAMLLNDAALNDIFVSENSLDPWLREQLREKARASPCVQEPGSGFAYATRGSGVTYMPVALPVHRELSLSSPLEHPVTLQIGIADVHTARHVAKLLRFYPYQAVNINCGCPSPRVSGHGGFGVSLMRHPELVRDIAGVVHDQYQKETGRDLEITVKCRLGISPSSLSSLCEFINTVSRGPVTHFIVHARDAVLTKGTNTQFNRTIPPLRYQWVYELVRRFPHLRFTLNGGVRTYEDCFKHLRQGVAGVMVGRAVEADLLYWRNVDSELYGDADPGLSFAEVVEKYAEYCGRTEVMHRGVKRAFDLPYVVVCGIADQQPRLLDREVAGLRNRLFRPLMTLVKGRRGSAACRKALSLGSQRLDLPADVVVWRALQLLGSPVPQDPQPAIPQAE